MEAVRLNKPDSAAKFNIIRSKTVKIYWIRAVRAEVDSKLFYRSGFIEEITF